jgi:hypothetical protein|tara:strand:+ start:141 stop:278 length:138 start_codon:yes stop_codon:yes gene_type:complete
MDIPGRADLAAPLDVTKADGELALQAVFDVSTNILPTKKSVIRSV